MDLNTDPIFASEAQESFTPAQRVFAIEDTLTVTKGAEGTYRGSVQNDRMAVIDWDTPSGEGFREAVPFAQIKSLYR